MKQSLRKIIIAIFFVSMSLLCSAKSSIARVTIDDLNYELFDDRTCTLTGVSSGETFNSYTLPEYVYYNDDSYTLTEIGSLAFSHCEQLEIFYVPNTVVTIKDSAFAHLPNLREVKLGISLEVIEEYAFYDCENLENVEFGPNIKKLGRGCFSLCGFKDFSVPASICEIEGGGIPDGSLRRLMFEDSETPLIVNANFRKEWNPLLSIAYIGRPIINSNEAGLFEESALLEVTFGESVTEIPDNMFKGSVDLTKFTMPEDLKTIGAHAFDGCYSLVINDFPSSLETIMEYAFYSCGKIESPAFNEGLVNIGACAFSDCNIYQINIPNTLKFIGSGAFSGNWRMYRIYASISTWCEIEFDGLGANPLTASANARLFYGDMEMTNLNIPNSVTKINDYAFYGCNFERVFFPKELKSIGNYNFQEIGNIYTTCEVPPFMETSSFNVTGNIFLPSKSAYDNFSNSENWKDKNLEYADFSPTEVNVKIGDEIAMLFKWLPSGVIGSKYDCVFMPSDYEVLELVDNWKFKAIGVGECNIDVSMNLYDSMGYGSMSYSLGKCKVTVNPILAESISLDKTELTLTIGVSEKLTATVLPEDVTDKTVTWSTSDAAIATVDNEGNVTAVAVGEATITATCGDKTATCKVTVNPILAESITLDKTELSLTIGETEKLTATVLPEDVTDKTVTWSTSDAAIATVDNEGNVTAVAVGEATITATCGDKTATCKVTVNPILAESITLDKTELSLTIGETEKLTATVLPEDVTDKTITWSTSDAPIATVDNEGKVTAISVGEATITATCGDKSATCKVTVNPILAESISLDKTELTLTIGASEKLTATVLPEDVTDKTVTWSTSDASIATVDNEGKVTAVSIGVATITATCGDKSATCKVTVNPILADSITLDKTELTLTIGASEKLTATVLPEDVTDKTVTWSTSDAAIATVDNEGNVTAISVGEATITATCGEISTSCRVIVEKISGIVFVSADDINIVVNGNELTIKGVTSEDKVTIVRQDGAVIYSGNNRESYPLVRGLYIILVNDATYKVVIN